MLTGFPRTRWPRLRFSESYAVRISVKISRICEFRVIMGIMTGLLGCCSSSTLGSRANDYVKTLATLGFWLHHSPCSLGCWTNNTLAARSLSPKHITPCTVVITPLLVWDKPLGAPASVKRVYLDNILVIVNHYCLTTICQIITHNVLPCSVHRNDYAHVDTLLCFVLLRYWLILSICFRVTP